MNSAADSPLTAPPRGMADRPLRPALARAVEHAILSSRWILAPLYLGLIVSLLLLLGKFAQVSVNLLVKTFDTGIDKLLTGILALVDLSLMGNLIVIVMFAGYENFVSRFSVLKKAAFPDWMGQVSFGALKLKLMTSIVAIGAVHLLEDFMRVDQVSDRELGWSVGILCAFVFAGTLLALMDRLSGDGH